MLCDLDNVCTMLTRMTNKTENIYLFIYYYYYHYYYYYYTIFVDY